MNERADTDTPGVLDPIAASRLIGSSYLRYLKARYAPADDRLRAELHDALDNRFQLDCGPFLQAASAYQKGHSLESLALEGLLHRRVLDIDSEVLPPGRPCTSTRRLRFAKPPTRRNLVIATGTGSGKTECYLLPILDRLLREADSGTLAEPGVRALAVVPDERVGQRPDEPHPRPTQTVSRDHIRPLHRATPERRRDGEQDHRSRFGADPDPGELVSRDQMRETPPHVLLTNYAMLEYLLLRPADTTFLRRPDRTALALRGAR